MNSVYKALESLASFSDAKSGYTLGPLNWNFGQLGPTIHALGKIFGALADILKGVK
ncbi:MAG: hypothetical protein Q3972_00295 [Corynebacterium sp.]|nr:hypothetical protein [Corynebacterium sp.]